MSETPLYIQTHPEIENCNTTESAPVLLYYARLSGVESWGISQTTQCFAAKCGSILFYVADSQYNFNLLAKCKR